VWDQEGCIGKWRHGQQRLTDDFQAFRGAFGVAVKLCAPADPEAKGLVERANGYLETSFLPGRSFESIADFNTQLVNWLRRANNRIHATTKTRPADAIFEDRGSMLTFPPVLPDVSRRWSLRLPRDHFVRVETNDYSVNPRFVGRRVEVRVTLEEVVVVCEGTEVARHRRFCGQHQTILAAEHARVLRALRAEARLAETPALDADVEVRDLSVYDRLGEVG